MVVIWLYQIHNAIIFIFEWNACSIRSENTFFQIAILKLIPLFWAVLFVQ